MSKEKEEYIEDKFDVGDEVRRKDTEDSPVGTVKETDTCGFHVLVKWDLSGKKHWKRELPGNIEKVEDDSDEKS